MKNRITAITWVVVTVVVEKKRGGNIDNNCTKQNDTYNKWSTVDEIKIIMKVELIFLRWKMHNGNITHIKTF